MTRVQQAWKQGSTTWLQNLLTIGMVHHHRVCPGRNPHPAHTRGQPGNQLCPGLASTRYAAADDAHRQGIAIHAVIHSRDVVNGLGRHLEVHLHKPTILLLQNNRIHRGHGVGGGCLLPCTSRHHQQAEDRHACIADRHSPRLLFKARYRRIFIEGRVRHQYRETLDVTGINSWIGPGSVDTPEWGQHRR